MPKVGNKKFPYTAKGKKAAKAYAMAEKMESKSEKKMEVIMPQLVARKQELS